MKRKYFLSKLFLLLLTSVLLFAGFASVKANANPADYITTKGAQIRTEGEPGIRFVQVVDTEAYDFTGATFGAVVAFGKAEATEDFKIGGTVNGKTVLNAEVESLKDNSEYYITLKQIPESFYLQDVTARAYVTINEVTYYSSSIVTRSLAQVATLAKNDGNNTTVVNDILTYVDQNYMITYTEYSGNFVVTSDLYETNVANLESQFVKDWNNKFGTDWTELTYAKLQASAAEGETPLTATSNDDGSGTNMYSFFNEGETAQKWRWFLHYLLEVGTGKVHPANQINALLTDGVSPNKTYHLQLFKHLSASIANFFNGGNAKDTNDILFEDVTMYDEVKNFNGKIENYGGVYATNAKLVKIGDSIEMPLIEEKLGHSILGWKLDAETTLLPETNYTITSTSVTFTPSYQQNINMDIIYVASNASEEFTYSDLTLVYGVNLFSTISEALAVVEAGKTVCVLPGNYSENVTIEKAVTLTSLNATINPNTDKTAFTSNETQVLLTGRVLLQSANITISGLTFTGNARVVGYGNTELSKIVFTNNYVFNTSEATIAFKATRYGNGTTSESTLNSTYPGFLTLAHATQWVKNLTVTDNVFSNVSDTNVYVVCTSGITITGNTFEDCDREAIRFDYNNNHGTMNIKNNTFKNIQYNAINVRSHGSSSGSTTINVEYNTFTNVAYNETKEFYLSSTSNAIIGCISSAAHQESTVTTLNVKYNTFNNCDNYITTRINCKANQYNVNISYNAFIDDNASTVAYSATSGSNQQLMTFNNNFYGINETTKVTPTSSQYDATTLKAMDTVTYDSVAALEEAIAALN